MRGSAKHNTSSAAILCDSKPKANRMESSSSVAFVSPPSSEVTTRYNEDKNEARPRSAAEMRRVEEQMEDGTFYTVELRREDTLKFVNAHSRVGCACYVIEG